VTDSPTALITEALKRIRAQRPENEVAVVLIGSAARDTATAQSDLDLLVLATPQLEVPRTPDRLHVQSMDEQVFLERLKSGDDFAAWCVRFGVPISASKFWLELTSSPAAAVWPDWHQKIPHAARRLVLASSLVETGDVDAATEEALYAATHTGRAILLKKDTFPLSRPEMIQQLRESGHKHLSDLVKTLLFDAPSQRVVKQAVRYLKRLLLSLDRQGYLRFVEERRRGRRLRTIGRKPRRRATTQSTAARRGVHRLQRPH
jgi:predicted nucleotidyltransferase